MSQIRPHIEYLIPSDNIAQLFVCLFDTKYTKYRFLEHRRLYCKQWCIISLIILLKHNFKACQWLIFFVKCHCLQYSLYDVRENVCINWKKCKKSCFWILKKKTRKNPYSFTGHALVITLPLVFNYQKQVSINHQHQTSLYHNSNRRGEAMYCWECGLVSSSWYTGWPKK